MNFKYGKPISDGNIGVLCLGFAGLILAQLVVPNAYSRLIIVLELAGMPFIWHKIYRVNRLTNTFEFAITDLGFVVSYRGGKILYCWQVIDLIDTDEMGNMVIHSAQKNMELPIYKAVERYTVFKEALRAQAIKHSIRFFVD